MSVFGIIIGGILCLGFIFIATKNLISIVQVLKEKKKNKKDKIDKNGVL